jgi:hypothetical protein
MIKGGFSLSPGKYTWCTSKSLVIKVSGSQHIPCENAASNHKQR